MSKSDPHNQGDRRAPEDVKPPSLTTDPRELAAQTEAALAQVAELRRSLEHFERLATLGTIAGLIAHEFNNVLTPVVSYAQMALAAPDDRELSTKALQRALSGAERASKIAGTILGFVRDDPASGVVGSADSSPGRAGDDDAAAGRSTWNTASQSLPTGSSSDFADVHDAVTEALACIARDPGRDGISVKLEIDPGLSARIRPVALQHVLMNLVLNARSAMLGGDSDLDANAHDSASSNRSDERYQPGKRTLGRARDKARPRRSGGEIRIIAHVTRLEPHGAEWISSVQASSASSLSGPMAPLSTRAARPSIHGDERVVHLDVIDTGRGMTRRRLERMFVPFLTSDHTYNKHDLTNYNHKSERRRGTGLGMTICKRLVEDVGGWLLVKSEPGRGTTVRIVLPLAQQAGKTAA